ncbi:transmembrane protein 145-like [Argiope bruennichi]|uniref:transmembrane protein 145-like n=1 Tax=Argiope bruennichi TaxID=94029 RepID=UPI002494C533|nr:transmembrane protein 145-like [Argiope bruennichi]
MVVFRKFYGKFISLIIIVICYSIVESKIIQGELRTKENWAFITRFCFLSELGMFEYDIEYPKEFKTQNILLYYDEKNQWPAVYKKNKTCREKESVLFVPNGQVIYLNETTFRSGCFDSTEEGMSGWLHCHSRRTFQSRRERWWFIAISNCDANLGLFLRYRFTMTNDEHNLWFKHFSADELYILQTDICFLVLYVVLLLMSFVEAQALRARHLFHRTYTLYLFSVILECTGLAFLCAYYAIYAQDGSAGIELKLLGKVLEALSTLLLLTLLIFIAKGYTVTRGRLRKKTLLKIAGFLWMYIVVYVILFLYERKFFDLGQVLYIYESPAGYGIIGLRLIGWAWFVYAVIFTMMHYPEKSNFYTKLFLLYSVWFLSAPVVILISTFIVPKWVREKLLNTVELFISIAAHFVFFVLTRPSKANKNFPYHVRTSQIGVMLQTNGATPIGDSSLDKFAHHPYALTSPNPTPNYAAIFGIQANGNHHPPTEMVTYGPAARPSAPPMADAIARQS